MALARVKVWNPGDVLTAADLNAEFNNLINNPITLISPTTGVITFSTSQTFPVTQVVTSGGPVLAAAVPTRVNGLSGTLSSQTGTFSANSYLMQSTNGLASWPVAATSAFSASVGVAGPAAGGRDIAAVFASTYVHWYAISTGQFSTAPAAVVSTRTPPTGPVMPAGYTGWTYLGGSIYTSASTTVARDHSMNGSWTMNNASPTVLSAGNAVAETIVSISSEVPSNAMLAQLDIVSVGVTADGGGALVNDTKIRYATGVDFKVFTFDQQVAVGTRQYIPGGIVIIPNIGQFRYLHTITNGSAGRLTVAVQGFQNPNGDV